MTSSSAPDSKPAGPAPIRHGEIMLVPCAAPQEAVVAERAVEVMVGHSETGHHHVLECPAPIEVIRADGMVVRLSEPGMLVQRKEADRHRDLPVAAGWYRVVRKSGYAPYDMAIKPVVD